MASVTLEAAASQQLVTLPERIKARVVGMRQGDDWPAAKS